MSSKTSSVYRQEYLKYSNNKKIKLNNNLIKNKFFDTDLLEICVKYLDHDDLYYDFPLIGKNSHKIACSDYYKKCLKNLNKNPCPGCGYDMGMNHYSQYCSRSCMYSDTFDSP